MGSPRAFLEGCRGKAILGVAPSPLHPPPPVPTWGFVQDKQKVKLGFLNAWHGSEAERQAGSPVPARPTWAGPGAVRSPPASPQGWASLSRLEGRKELSALGALEEGWAAINSEPREGGS